MQYIKEGDILFLSFFVIFVAMMLNWLSVVTGFFYIVLGVFVVVKKWFFTVLEPGIAFALGGLMVLYGIFRIGRAIYRLRNDNRDEEE